MRDAAKGTPLVAVRGLRVTYDEGSEPALRGIDLDIMHAERLAVIGESGSGKSTLALAIANLAPASVKMTGSIRWFGNQERPHSGQPPCGQPPSGLPPIGETEADGAIPLREEEIAGRSQGGKRGRGKEHAQGIGQPVHGRDVGFVFQDPAASLDPVLTVGEQVAEVIRAHSGLSWKEAYGRAADLFARVSLPDPRGALGAYPHQLSGGQKQRVGIAAAIAAAPRLLIADEATSALDTIVQAEIVALLRRLSDEDGMTLLFISHDIALAAGLADRIAVFRRGEAVELGRSAEVIAAPRHAYTRALLSAHIGLDTPPLVAAVAGRSR